MPRRPSQHAIAIATALVAMLSLGACSSTGQTREPGAVSTRVAYSCSGRQVIRVVYDNTTPAAPVARVVFDGRTFEMRSTRSERGSTRYATDSGLREGQGLQWLTRGNEATLSEVALDDPRAEPVRIATCRVVR
jgi:membrane-bound inhibitor of C-type lysozyme